MSKQKFIKINMNSYVYVKFTERGLAILKTEHENIRRLCPSIGKWEQPEVDLGGYSRVQLWGLFEKFGPHINIGLNIPFETDIYFEAPPCRE
jgi:hypothetical protein